MSLEENWPLVVPPLLTLIDDVLASNKVRGCELLTSFLQTCPPVLLQRTGLGEVFESTLMQYLLYLPTIVPEEECLQILRAIYPTLIILTNSRYPEKNSRGLKLKCLDKVMREGIFKGYAHAGERIHVAEMLLQQMVLLIEEMGIWCVKHLKVRAPGFRQSKHKSFKTRLTSGENTPVYHSYCDFSP